MVGALAFVLWGFGATTLEAAISYRRHAPESFSGARLHLSPWQSSGLATLNANARWHGDMLFSLPGMFSFNLWSGLPTPTQANITQWWVLLNERQQAAIAAQLAAAARPVVIVQRNLIASGIHKANYRPSLLTLYLTSNFTRRFTLDTYEFWTRQDAAIEPINLAHWQPSPSITSPAATMFSFSSPDGELDMATRLELWGYGRGTASTLAVLQEFNLVRTSTAKDSAAGTLHRWQCSFVSSVAELSTQCDSARFYAADGRLLLEVRFERASQTANPN